MLKEDKRILSRDGKTQLHLITWQPEKEPKAIVQLVHGMAEHMERYHDFAVYLTQRGYAVIGHDHLGHGQSLTSPDKLGFFAEKDGNKILIQDMFQVTEYAKTLWPGKKLFILGHSMGSFLVRRFLTLHSRDVDAAVIMGTGNQPALASAIGLKIAKRAKKKNGPMSYSKTLNNMALGSNNKPFKPNRTPFDWLSRNEENVDRYMADRLCGFDFTVSAWADFFQVLQELAHQEDVDGLVKSLPLLITSGELDPVGGEKGCKAVLAKYQKLGMEDVRLKLYPEDRHEILNEIDRDKVFKDLGDWFDSKL